MNQMATVSGDILEGVSATTLWTLHNRGTEAKRSDGVIRDPWAVTLFDAISYDYRKFGRPNQAHPLRALAFDAATRLPREPPEGIGGRTRRGASDQFLATGSDWRR
jgi:O-methyltransferase involved in polyketide biosynthesis